MKLHMSHYYCMESVRKADCLPALVALKNVGNSGGLILAKLPPIHTTSLPSKLGGTILARHARSRNHPESLHPAGTTHVALISSQPSSANLTPNTLCVLNHSSINQRIENLLRTHKFHTPDLVHFALNPFALLVRCLVGTRNHQAQLLFLWKGQHL
jgi:hypothetical protein